MEGTGFLPDRRLSTWLREIDDIVPETEERVDVSGLPADCEWGKSDKGDGVPFFAPVWTGGAMAAVFCIGRGDEVSLGAAAG